MPQPSKLETFRLRAARALGDHKVADAVAKVRAIIGPTEIPASEAAAQAAFNKLREGEVPTPEEQAALEIVIRLLRPVVYSRKGGELDDLPDDEGHNLHPQELKDLWSSFRVRAKSAMGSIGRVELDGAHVGTGFLVTGGLLATNRHVLAALTYGSEVLVRGKARVVFKQEHKEINPPDAYVGLEDVVSIHPRLDMVLIRLAKHERLAVEFEAQPLKDAARVVVIGYPGEDKQNNPLFLGSVFGAGFGVRRAALGEVLDGTDTPNLFHDSSTTRGNSGSPIFSLETGKVAGIHRAGYFMYRNEAVDIVELSAFVEEQGK